MEEAEEDEGAQTKAERMEPYAGFSFKVIAGTTLPTATSRTIWAQIAKCHQFNNVSELKSQKKNKPRNKIILHGGDC